MGIIFTWPSISITETCNYLDLPKMHLHSTIFLDPFAKMCFIMFTLEIFYHFENNFVLYVIKLKVWGFIQPFIIGSWGTHSKYWNSPKHTLLVGKVRTSQGFHWILKDKQLQQGTAMSQLSAIPALLRIVK